MNPFADATAASLLDTVANRHGTREAMVFGNERLTYADFAARSRRLAGGLAALGVGRGDKVQRAKLREQVIVDLGLGVGAPRR